MYLYDVKFAQVRVGGHCQKPDFKEIFSAIMTDIKLQIISCLHGLTDDATISNTFNDYIKSRFVWENYRRNNGNQDDSALLNTQERHRNESRGFSQGKEENVPKKKMTMEVNRRGITSAGCMYFCTQQFRLCVYMCAAAE